jgi:DNA repair photolyase
VKDAAGGFSILLRPFDPWKSPLCTCPAKLSLNPYTGCSHGCLYCYASSYIPHFGEVRPKVDLIARLKREIRKIKNGVIISISNSSDPYPPLEREMELTRRCIELLAEKDVMLQMVTKSDIVARDSDLLMNIPSTVSITITTLNDPLAKRLEPGAPLPRRRLAAIRQLSKKGIPVSARIDPLIPLINEMEIEDLISAVCKAGACHIISSTYKAKPDNWKRLSNCFSEECEVLRPLYFDHGQIMSGSRYLPVELRAELLRRVNDVCLENAITFSTCREDLFKPTDISCDGSHLIKNTWNYSRAPNKSDWLAFF